MDIETFYLGLLQALAAREDCRSFSSWGDKFYRRFVAVAQLAQQNAPEPVADIEWMTGVDPTFGNSKYAEGLIAFGMSSRCLTLDSPDMITARLRPPSDQIRAMIGHTAWFDELAKKFAETN